MAQNKSKDASYVNDFQTPENVAKYMVSLLNMGGGKILEPTPGLGSIVKELELNGFNVTAPKDYWELDKDLKFDGIVANLPFSSKTFFNCPPEFEGKGMKVAYEQMKVLMKMSDNLILLMPWFTISDSDVRLRMLKNYGLISVTALPRKTFQYARIQTCVLQLQKGYTGPAEFKVFELI
jgi:type I restriction-modification system DNA methylase subunit